MIVQQTSSSGAQRLATIIALHVKRGVCRYWFRSLGGRGSAITRERLKRTSMIEHFISQLPLQLRIAE
jgi:hypothetical protein